MLLCSYEDMRDVETWLDRHLNRFSSDDRITFFDLADCRTPALTDGQEEKSALGIFFTNDMARFSTSYPFAFALKTIFQHL